MREKGRGGVRERERHMDRVRDKERGQGERGEERD